MEKIKLFIEGLIIGFGKIMPGVSGSVMAICFGVYERLICAISSIKNFKKDFFFVFILSVSMFLSIILGSNIIKFLLSNYFLFTISYFIGMMIPGIFPLLKEVKNEDLTFKRTMIAVILFFFLILLNVINITGENRVVTSSIHEFFSLFLCGLIDAASTIIPGISGSAILMLLGYYEEIISSLATIFTFSSIKVLMPFFMGLIIGIISISKLITYLFREHRVLSFILIIVFAVFSIFTLTTNVLKFISNFYEFIMFIIFLTLGFFTSKILEKTFSK